MARHALALWFAALAALGALRGWMMWRAMPAGAETPLALWLWGAGSAACALVAAVALAGSLRRE